MARSSSLSVAESSIYRNIYDGLRNSSSMDRCRRAGVATSMDSQRWTFLQRLMAIEEAHDKKREAREDRVRAAQRASKVSTGQDGATEPNTQTQTENLSRWLHSQIFDDEPDEAQRSDDEENYQHNNHLHDNDNRLPPLHNPVTRETSERVMASTQTSLPAISETSRCSDADKESYLELSEELVSHSPQLESTSQTQLSRLPSVQGDAQRNHSSRPRRKRPLKLPPILLPSIYTITPRPLQYREFLTPTKIRGPITDEEWEELKDCRYIRPAVPRFALQMSTSNMSSLQF